MKPLKKTSILFMTMLSMVLTNASFAFEGGIGDGGGNAYSSSPADVNRFVRQLKMKILLPLISEVQTRQFLNPTYTKVADIKNLLEKFVGGMGGTSGKSGVALLDDALNSTYVAKKTCEHQGIPSDASTLLQRNAEICFSHSLLSRYPKGELEVEITTLAMHELAHHFGANERIANEFQNFMKETVRDFFRMGIERHIAPVKDEHVWEMRPGGIVEIGEGKEKISVLCFQGDRDFAHNGGEPTHGDIGGNAVIILAGQSLIVGPSTGLHAVTCKDYPAVDCKIEDSQGKKYISFGDISYSTWNEENLETKLAQLQMAGVCSRSGSK